MKTRLTTLGVLMVGMLIGVAGLMSGSNPGWQRALYGLGLCLMLLGGVRAIVRPSKQVRAQAAGKS